MEYKYEWKDGKVFSNNSFWYGYNPIIVVHKETGQEHEFGRKVTKDCRQFLEYNPSLYYQDFWNFACATAPDACSYAPEVFQTPELVKVIATNTSYKNNLQRMALKKLEKEVGRDAVIEIYNIMIDRFRDAISDVSEEYMIDEVINPALVKYCSALSGLPVSQRTDERCILSVSTWGNSLAAVPDDKKNLVVTTEDGEKKLYEIAISVSGMALGAVPEEEITVDLCIEALKVDGNAIKYVPSSIITREFVSRINQAGIVIPPRYRCSVKNIINMKSENGECVEIDDLNFNMVRNIQNYAQYEDIKLSDIPYMFNKKLIDKLERYGITSVGELFDNYEDLDFMKDGSNMFIELPGIVNVLKCKFRGEDPKIDLDSTDASYMVSKIGLALPVAKDIERKGLSIRDLLEQSKLPPVQQVWSHCFIGVGKSTMNSCIEKVAILSQYYNRIDSDKNTDDELVWLNAYLGDLKNESAVLDAKIEETINRIAELATKKVMSSGGSYVKK